MESKIDKLTPFLNTFVAIKKLNRKISNNKLSKIELTEMINGESNSLLKLLVDTTDDIQTLKILSENLDSKKLRKVALEKIKKAGN
jgi:hypothetical protein